MIRVLIAGLLTLLLTVLGQAQFFNPPAIFFPSAVATTTTWNPSDKGTKVALSGGNLTAANTGSSGVAIVRSIASHASGKYYWEITFNVAGTGTLGVGICDSTKSLNATFLGGDTHGAAYYANTGGTNTDYNATAAAIQTITGGQTAGIAIDIANNGLWYRTNGGNWNNNVTSNPITNTLPLNTGNLNSGPGAIWSNPIFACVDVEGTTDSVTANFGATAYGTAAPIGFGNL